MDQLIKGPFKITDEWQTIRLDKPLETIPYMLSFDVLIDMDEYEYKHIEGTPDDPHRLMFDSFYKMPNGDLIYMEIILVAISGEQFHTIYNTIGSTEVRGKSYKYLGFGTNPDLGKFYYPEGIEIVALKIRSNVPMIAEYFDWNVFGYEIAKKQTWADVDPTEIVSFDYISDE
ncbi:hypothetical Protein YC6258_04014 [Gynuella sunshinyii YC6258]|uniref:Uncharacterized protein n=1 Tax=Gynuella sunshinyii YC6258 TaxID=1445510 RepID=A0A0C5V9K9_9GAMM|nr:hypothetical Protein YC6258_04014 [Gynuella sunshinyii YC6258]